MKELTTESGGDLPKVAQSIREPRLQLWGYGRRSGWCYTAWGRISEPRWENVGRASRNYLEGLSFSLVNLLINHWVSNPALFKCCEEKCNKGAWRHPKENKFQPMRAWPGLGVSSLLGRVLIFHILTTWFQGLKTVSGTQLVLHKCRWDYINKTARGPENVDFIIF